MPTRDAFPDTTSPEIEDLRQGTRKQYISEWELLAEDEARTFQHGLGEIPWNVSVCLSSSQDGTNSGALYQNGLDLLDDAVPATPVTMATVLISSGTITITASAAGAGKYFQVRSM